MDSNNADISSLKIDSLNVNSVGKSEKRRRILNFLSKRNSDLYILVDTRIDPKIENTVRSEWPGTCFFNSFSSQKRGILVLIKKNLPVTVESIHNDNSGNLLVLLLNFQNKKILLNVIYGPNTDDPDFYQNEVFKNYDNLDIDHFIYCGDWNMALNQKLDTKNYSHENNVNARNSVLAKMNENDFIDIWRYQNPISERYTWFKGAEKCARLDFFLCSDTLLPYVTNSNISSAIETDHSIVHLSVDFAKFERGRGTWKFNNSLLKDIDYVNLIKQVMKQTARTYCALDQTEMFWDSASLVEIQRLPLNIDPQLFFDTLLIEIRGETIKYSSRKKRTLNQRFINLTKELNDLENLISANQNGDNFQERISIIRTELETLNKVETEGAALRCKAIYSLQGEKPTKYFCNLEKKNANLRYIPALRNELGIINEQKKIDKEIFRFYKSLYKQPNPPSMSVEDFLGEHLESLPKATETEKSNCEGPIKMVEIVLFLKKLKNNKSPGSTGYTGEFYKFFFNDFKYWLHDSLNFTYENEKLPVSQNIGITTLLPKPGKDKQLLKNWRPLCLLSTYYKIISGIISERLKPVLNRIIHPDQKGYLPGRYMGEVIRTMYDSLSYANSNNKGGLLILLDFEKAFDMIAFQFIKNTLRIFNFGDSIIRWIRILTEDFYSCINHAGNLSPRFKLERGCKQGDPISGYLYILCSEILAHKLRSSCLTDGFDIGESKNLLDHYADDLSIYLSVDPANPHLTEVSLRKIFDVLDRFRKVSGLKANLEKTSAVWFGSMKDSDLKICENLNLTWTKTFKILGITLDTSLDNLNLSIKTNMDDVKKLLKNWRYRYLTPYGKIVILKSLALSKLTHLSLILPELSDELADTLEKIFLEFLWDGKPDKVDRISVKMPQSMGGLNFPDIKTFWSALKISWLRRLFNDKNCSFWKKILNVEFASTEYSIDDLFTLGDTGFLKLSNSCRNKFWKSVFLGTHEMLKSVVYCHVDYVGLLPVCNNSLFKIDGLPISKQYFNNRLDIQIIDFLTSDNKYKSVETFNLNTGLDLNFLNYASVLSSIKKSFRLLNMNIARISPMQKPHQSLLHLILSSTMKGCKKFYNLLNSKSRLLFSTSNIEEKWHNELNTIYDISTWDSVKRIHANLKDNNNLKWLQFRIMRRSLPTNRILCYFVPNTNNVCNFCHFAPDDISHAFFNCHIIQQFLQNVDAFLREQNIIIPLNLKHFLFGILKEPISTLSNMIILYCKGYIWQCKQNDSLPNLLGFKRHLIMILKTIHCKNLINPSLNMFEDWRILYEHLIADLAHHET